MNRARRFVSVNQFRTIDCSDIKDKFTGHGRVEGSEEYQ